MIEAAAESSEEILNKYLEQGELGEGRNHHGSGFLLRNL